VFLWFPDERLEHQCSIFSAAVLLPPPDELLRHIKWSCMNLIMPWQAGVGVRPCNETDIGTCSRSSHRILAAHMG